MNFVLDVHMNFVCRFINSTAVYWATVNYSKSNCVVLVIQWVRLLGMSTWITKARNKLSVNKWAVSISYTHELQHHTHACLSEIQSELMSTLWLLMFRTTYINTMSFYVRTQACTQNGFEFENRTYCFLRVPIQSVIIPVGNWIETD